MKRKFPLLLFLTLSKLALAQNPYLDYKYALKISNLSTLQLHRAVPQYALSPYGFYVKTGDNVYNQLQLFHPTVAFDWMTKRKNTREFEVIDLVLNGQSTRKYTYEVNGVTEHFQEKTATTAISIRYQYIINYCKQKESKWVPSLGFSFNPYYQYTSSNGSGPLSYHTSEQTLGIRASINPRITYFFSKNLYVFAEMSYTMLDISGTTSTNPANAWQSNQKGRQTHYNVTGIKDRFEFRVGLGYKF
jgi:hypothetical protein